MNNTHKANIKNEEEFIKEIADLFKDGEAYNFTQDETNALSEIYNSLHEKIWDEAYSEGYADAENAENAENTTSSN